MRSADDVAMGSGRALLNARTDRRFPFSEVFAIEVGDVQLCAVQSRYPYSEVGQAERRVGVLRSYGVHAPGD